MHPSAGFLIFLTLLDADPLNDLQRFPQCCSVCRSNREFAQHHVQWLEARNAISCRFAEEHYQWLEDARWCYRCWDVLEDIRMLCDTNDMSKISNHAKNRCREKLGDLRIILGEEAYAAGYMPPSVPVWWFRKID